MSVLHTPQIEPCLWGSSSHTCWLEKWVHLEMLSYRWYWLAAGILHYVFLAISASAHGETPAARLTDSFLLPSILCSLGMFVRAETFSFPLIHLPFLVVTEPCHRLPVHHVMWRFHLFIATFSWVSPPFYSWSHNLVKSFFSRTT